MLQPSDSGPSDLSVAYDRLRSAWERDGELSLSARRDALRVLRHALVDHAESFANALDEDFGGRSRHESLLTEVALLVSAIDYTVPRIAKWAKPQRLYLELPHSLASAKLVKRGRGVAGIIGPSNYPLQLALMPLIGALSAGCRTIIKPSEGAPRTAALLRSIIAETIDPEIVSIVCGGADIAEALSHLPLDILLFTGSHRIGVKVAAAAAKNLTPVVLELGGKSPVIIDPSSDLARSAVTIMRGKLMNAGQTCVAPDYILVPRERFDELVECLRQAAAALYPDPKSGDYTAMLSTAASDRLRRLEAGHKTVSLFSQALQPPFYDPKLVLSPSIHSDLMQEEIFGPLLPVIGYESLGEVLNIVNSLPPPLVIYWFGTYNERSREVIRTTSSGAVSINETVLHAGISGIPLGGIGASGLGRYHGQAGFDTFSFERPIFKQSALTVTNMLKPPYGQVAERILRWLLRKR